jgi:hypothetical protein
MAGSGGASVGGAVASAGSVGIAGATVGVSALLQAANMLIDNIISIKTISLRM